MTMEGPLDISVVTHNSRTWIESFLDSLLAQAYPPAAISLLWRDNGSTDGTLDVLHALKERYAGRFRRFPIDRGENVGFGRGHNANLVQAESDFFLVANADLRFEPDTLTRLLSVARADAADVAAWECRQKPYEHPKLYHPATGDTEWCSCACALFRVGALRAVKGFEPRLFLYGEDVELSYRLRDQGHRLRYVPQAVVWHYTYREAAELKPAQFLGSTLAHVLLRCRYGRPDQVLAGFLMYAGLFLLPPAFPGQRAGLLRGAGRLMRLAPAFLLTRHSGRCRFGFRGWNYGVTREGAFYAFPEGASSEAAPRPRVSILVRTMPGRAGKLSEAVASVVAQTYPDIELVIVEDGGSSAEPAAVALRESGRFSAVRYQSLDKVGRCAAGNAALALATGDLLGFLDDDDLLFADHVEVLVGEWAREPALGAVYGLAWQVRTEVIRDEPWDYRDIEHSQLYREPFDRAILWHHNYLPIQTVLFHRRLYERWGGFDPALDNLEDWNLWVRYSLHDDFRLVEKTTSYYRVPAAGHEAARRQQALDDHYVRALEKHAQLAVPMSPTRFLEMAKRLNHALHVVSVEKAQLQRHLFRFRVAHRFYHLTRRLWHAFRRRRQRG